MSVLTRTLWRYRFEKPDERRTAFAIDSVLIAINFTVGPALIGLILLVGTPAAAFGATWVFAALAAPLFLLSPARRYWKHAPNAERDLLGPLTERRLLNVYATSSALTFAFGMLEVGYPGFAARAGNPALGGALLAICSIGSRGGDRVAAVAAIARGAGRMNSALREPAFRGSGFPANLFAHCSV